MQAVANSTGLVAQVGYMKRFDPVRARLERALADLDAVIEAVAVEVRDPDAAPFVSGFSFVPAGDDVDPVVVAGGTARFAAAVAAVIGRPASQSETTAWGSFIGALIHDLNFVRNFLPGKVTVEAGFTGMAGLQVGLHLRTADGVLARMTHTQVPHTADYQELVTFYTTAGIFEVVFPAPYLLHATTPLRHYTVKDARHAGRIENLNDSTEEAFELELHSFAHSITSGQATPERNGFEDAVADLDILESAMRLAVGA
jgi:predicted dehydrogenase